MLWRIRATMPDRPGALAGLARACGEADVNILSVQVFPGTEAVTDEVIVRAPSALGSRDLAHVVARADVRDVVAHPCTEAALTDQPTRFVQATRAIVAQPAAFPEVVAALFDAEATAAPADPAEPADGRGDRESFPAASGEEDTMDLAVGEVTVHLRRTVPFTATEHARGAAIAELVSDVLGRDERDAGIAGPPAPAAGETPEYRTRVDRVEALAGGTVIGSAALGPVQGEDGESRGLVVRVDPAWQRRGIGTTLVREVARLAARQEVAELVVTTRSDNHAVLPLLLATGLRSRIRVVGGSLVVRLGVRALAPVPGG